MTDPSNSVPVESMSVAKLFRALTVGQAWGLAVTVLGALGAAFGLGYQASSFLSEAKAGSDASLQQEYLAGKTRERFFALYVRYMLAKAAYDKDKSEANKATLNENKSSFREFVQDLVKRGESANGGIDTRGAFLNKGATDDASLKFADGTVWPLPREIGLAAGPQ